jgi:hypothetical protein
MSLSFPNQSRSYEPTRNGVRFWAYDEVLEITFFVDADVFCRPDSWTRPNEADILDAFDRNRQQIHALAQHAYRRHHGGAYTLTTADCSPIAKG